LVLLLRVYSLGKNKIDPRFRARCADSRWLMLHRQVLSFNLDASFASFEWCSC